ncbi:MAG: TIGR01777 family oxidoreductase [Mariniblastus sp.]|nr:TIGR01777 family oxidoreductase [Mariniblastus sp.]
MKILIPGGTGQVGQILAQSFMDEGHQVVVLSRKPASQPASEPWQIVPWDGRSEGEWQREVEAADVVINLAGRSVNCRYHERNRQEIMQSRQASTQAIGEAIVRAQNPPRLWLQMSTATIYAHRFDQPNDETTGILGGDEPGAPDTWRFSIDVASTWEATAEAFDLPATRQVIMRLAINMCPAADGAFGTFVNLVRRGMGGRQGDGRQFISWIHERDMFRAVNWLIDHEELSGAVNIAAPHPVTNAEFMKTLRQVCGVRFGLPIRPWMLGLGAWFMGTETELVLKSRRVIPTRLVESGFEFEYPQWPDAARELYSRWRDMAKT